MSFSCSSRTYRAYFTPTSKPIVAPTRKFAKLNQFTPPSVLCSVCWPFVLPLAWDECRFFSFPWPPLLLRSSDIVQLKQTLIKKRRTTLIHEWKLNWNVRWSTPKTSTVNNSTSAHAWCPAIISRHVEGTQSTVNYIHAISMLRIDNLLWHCRIESYALIVWYRISNFSKHSGHLFSPMIIQPDIHNGRPARMVESKLLVDRNNCNLYVFYTYIHTYINPEQARNLFRSTFQRVSSRLLQIFARG